MLIKLENGVRFAADDISYYEPYSQEEIRTRIALKSGGTVYSKYTPEDLDLMLKECYHFIKSL